LRSSHKKSRFLTGSSWVVDIVGTVIVLVLALALGGRGEGGRVENGEAKKEWVFVPGLI
jgi:hypothetical protein